ncbi:hypothetical protein BT96DRAFT_862492 [Gymnopus androsaceus JB14]|uniref:Sensitive to high expression protein 9, mitochondrial n=1 Tax=Gymnopus androsaceus JB14 TaxID=1447944 RepID=A0A6A4HC47_9AGAR|nr:hypothetical protein BT96DRAFT_862492 [Gymnopus androsaceus JB14]
MFRLSSLAKTKPPSHLRVRNRYYHPTTSTWNANSSLKGSTGNSPEGNPSASTSSESTSESSIDHSTSTSASSKVQVNPPNPPKVPEPPKPPSNPPLEKLRLTLLQWTNDRASQFRRKADDFTGVAKTRLSGLGAELNKVTGYEEIEALKRQVVEQEARIEITRQAARTAKLRHEEAVAQRSTSQRAVNDLLQRKSSWTDEDLIRFTSIVRQDHHFEQEEARARIAVDEAESAVEKEFTELMRSILGRYHEEQVWSDKIRSASTYGQLAVLGLNLLVFVLAIIVVEPWKRKRLAQTFEKKIEELNEQYKEVLAGNMVLLKQQLEEQAVAIKAIADVVSKVDVQTQPPLVRRLSLMTRMTQTGL